MVKTKLNTVGFFGMLSIFLIQSTVMASMIAKLYSGFEIFRINADRDLILLQLYGLVPITVMLGLMIFNNLKTVSVEPRKSVLYVRNAITRSKTLYHFNEFDGYFKSEIRRGPGFSSYDVICLVKDGKVIVKLDEYFQSKVMEAKRAMSGIPSLCHQKLGLLQRLKIALGFKIRLV